jgi:hypothetical protein
MTGSRSPHASPRRSSRSACSPPMPSEERDRRRWQSHRAPSRSVFGGRNTRSPPTRCSDATTRSDPASRSASRQRRARSSPRRRPVEAANASGTYRRVPRARVEHLSDPSRVGGVEFCSLGPGRSDRRRGVHGEQLPADGLRERHRGASGGRPRPFGGESGSRGVVTLSSGFSTTPSKKSCLHAYTSLRPPSFIMGRLLRGRGPCTSPASRVAVS